MTLPPHAGPGSDPGIGGAVAPGGSPLRSVPEASVARLALYLRVLGELAEQGTETVSSDELAGASGVNPAKLRKDLSYIGSYGIRGVGYEVAPLLRHLEHSLGLTQRQAVALVGVGNLGHALAGYAGFAGNGFPVVALFDIDSDLVGVRINGILIDHVDELRRVCAERGVTIGMIATPGQAAQGVCDQLVACGVRCILNFAPAVLQVPEDVEVRKVDLAVELQVLAFHVARRHLAAADGPLNAVAQAAAAAINGAGRRVTGGTS